MKTNVILKSMLALMILVGFASCSDDDDAMDNQTTYNAKVYITDGPIDNAEVAGVFVTIADVKVNGTSVDGFSKTTVNLHALQNGETQLLGDVDLTANTYNQVSLVLDDQSDAAGNSPANYVLTTSNEKIELTADNNTINVNSSFDIEATTTNEIVIDFDLRKAIVADATNAGYNFATQTQLESSVRVINKNNTGIITGTATNNTGSDGKIVAYAYTKGTYTASEAEENAAGVRFANAVTSSVATGTNNEFGLYFLNEGAYEIHFASYQDTNNDGVYEFEGMIEAEGNLGLDLLDVMVTANTEVSLQVLLLAIFGG
ncbi:MAG: hypothetical protein CL526_02545 [Aequorivita sp.]|nr:hypothetical protein [Aequorivita sp.]|tara:strand:- start:6801 stop:7748 length:948 start_codon:yes stop_codon:yes gene_type:complete